MIVLLVVSDLFSRLKRQRSGELPDGIVGGRQRVDVVVLEELPRDVKVCGRRLAGLDAFEQRQRGSVEDLPEDVASVLAQWNSPMRNCLASKT
jgi:hypothetical protein